MQRLCHARPRRPGIFVALACVSLLPQARIAHGEDSGHDYPTSARVEYVLDCMAKNSDSTASLYQCSCAIDRIAPLLSYDEFVEASTFVKYARLPGEGGGIFRDSKTAKQQAQRYKDVEQKARKSCGLGEKG